VKVEKLNPKVEVVFYGEIVLGRTGEERTAVRFSVRANGRVADVNQLPKALVPLRRATSAAEQPR
jgi:hypothetical protein